MERQPKTLEPPRNAIMQLSRAFSGLYGYMRDKDALALFPLRADGDGNINEIPTFTRGDRGHVDRYLHKKAMAGLPAIISELHMLMRKRANNIHDYNIEVINEQLRAVSVPIPHNKLDAYVAMLEGLSPQDETIRNVIMAHLKEVKAFQSRDTYTLEEKVYLLRNATQTYTALMREFDDDEHATPKHFNSTMDALFGDLPENFVAIENVHLVLRDAAGEAIKLTVRNGGDAEGEEKSILGLIAMGFVGKTGFLDRKKFPPCSRIITNKTVGDTANIAVALQHATDVVAESLKEAGHDNRTTDEILSKFGFNYSPEEWAGFFNAVRDSLAQAAYMEYVLRAVSDSASSTKPPLHQMEEIVASMNAALDGLPEPLHVEPLVLPKTEELAPRTRLEYYGLLGAIEMRLTNHFQLKKDRNPFNHANRLLPAMQELKARFAPDPAEKSIKGFAEQEVDVRERAEFLKGLEKLQRFYEQRAKHSRDEGLEALFALAHREPQRVREVS